MRVVETQLCMSSRGKTVVGKVNERKILRTRGIVAKLRERS